MPAEAGIGLKPVSVLAGIYAFLGLSQILYLSDDAGFGGALRRRNPLIALAGVAR